MPETEEERRIRKEREKKAETPEERAARKERERLAKESETPEQRAARKAKEAERDSRRKEETPEERAARKEREKKENETPEERAARKEKERLAKENETPEERAARKERERAAKETETPEQRQARKERERQKELERQQEKEKREVVHKPLPQTLQQQQQQQQQQASAPTVRPEPVVQGRNPNLPPPAPKKDEPDDYADDFVDGFEVEAMLEAQKAVAAENAALKKGTPTSSTGAASNVPAASPVIVGQSRFGADDLHRQQARAQFERDLARSTALRRLVDLDDVSAVIADIPPLSEYDMYIRNFGGAGRQQAGAQAPPLEDKVDQEVQAERVTLKSKGAQCPEDLGLFPEKPVQLQNTEGDNNDKNNKQTGGDSNQSSSASSQTKKGGSTTVDATLLSSFLSRVFPVMRTLLDEAHYGGNVNQSKSATPFSSTFTTFAVKEAVSRPVIKIAYSSIATQYLLSVHGPKQKRKVVASGTPVVPADRCDGLAVVWNSNDSTLPDKLLVHSHSLTTGCFSPSRSHLIYAGGSDGAVCVWDLREPDSAHASDERLSTVTLRSPSFITEWQGDNHPSGIVSMSVAGYNSVLGNRRDESDQIVTLDRSGNIYFWMVNDGGSGSSAGSGNAGSSPTFSGPGVSGKSSSDQDNGQLMASCVRVFRATTMTIPKAASLSSVGAYGMDTSRVGSGGYSCDLDFCPADPSRFVVAAGATVHHLSRFSSITAPSAYAPHSQFFGEAASSPSTVSFSTMDSRILLSGYTDGMVRVFLRDDALPQLSVPVCSVPIRQIHSSNTIKLITYVLDESGMFYILDHGIEEKEVPVVHCNVGTADTGRCSAFDVPPEDKVVSQLTFGFENGSIQLHVLSQQWLAPSTSRSEKWL